MNLQTGNKVFCFDMPPCGLYEYDQRPCIAGSFYVRYLERFSSVVTE